MANISGALCTLCQSIIFATFVVTTAGPQQVKMEEGGTMALRYPAVARNKQPILTILRELVEKCRPASERVRVLEVASGSGEHAAFFAAQIPGISIQPSEPDAALAASIRSWSKEIPPAPDSEVLLPLPVGVEQLSEEDLPQVEKACFDILICINMIHISPFSCTRSLFSAAKVLLRPGGHVFMYGPFREDGCCVESNEKFDASLQSRNASWGIRDLEEVKKVAEGNAMRLSERHEMPANNLCVIFSKK